MEPKQQEIEMKFPLHNPDELREFLGMNAKQFSDRVLQKDIYFTPAHRDFLAVRHPFEWLRLRESAKGASLDYKHYYPENAEDSWYCDEFQTSLGSLEAAQKILSALNFRQIFVVEKHRSVWVYKDAEVCIDEVNGLGTFIEIEATHHFPNPEDGRAYLKSVLAELNAKVGKEDFKGYPMLLIEKSKE